MKALDTQGKFGPFLLDPKRAIPAAHQKGVCKTGQGHSTCRYLALAVKGFVCVKNSPLGRAIDAQVKEGNFTAQGDNCEGFGLTYGKEAAQGSQDDQKSDPPQA